MYLFSFRFLLVITASFSAFCFSATNVSAHGDHHHKEGCHSCSQNQSPKNELRILAHTIHEAIAGEHAHYDNWREFAKSFFKGETWSMWLRGLKNLPNAHLNYRRSLNHYTNTHSVSKEFPQHAANVFVLYGIGEATEIFVIPSLGTYFAAAGESSAIAKGIVGTASFLTPLPGIEPVCGLIIGCYFLSKNVRKGTNWLVQNTWNFLHASIAATQNYQQYSRIELAQELFANLEQKLNFQLHTKASAKRFELEVKDSESTLFRMQFVVDAQQNPMGWQIEAYLERIEWREENPAQFFRAMKSLTSVFGKNVQQAVHEAFTLSQKAKYSELERRFYIQSSQTGDIGMQVNFKPHHIFVEAAKLKSKSFFLEQKQAACERVLLGL